MKRISIEPADAAVRQDWLRMRCALWPEGTRAEHRREIAAYFAGGSRDPLAVLVAYGPRREMLGFVELTLRSHAEGCAPGRIGYLEGWYVAPSARGSGVGRKLMQAAERWARAQGCREFASDAWAGNRNSRAAHRALGFEEVGTIRCFRKKLSGRRSR